MTRINVKSIEEYFLECVAFSSMDIIFREKETMINAVIKGDRGPNKYFIAKKHIVMIIPV